jgi:hypothetical protein
MHIEGQHRSVSDERAIRNGEEAEVISIQPERLSLSEAAERGRKKFSLLLRNADPRTLVRYLEKAKIRPKDIKGISDLWAAQFTSKEFRSQPYTWVNPSLYLITPKTAAEMAAAELLRRVHGSPSNEDIINKYQTKAPLGFPID